MGPLMSPGSRFFYIFAPAKPAKNLCRGNYAKMAPVIALNYTVKTTCLYVWGSFCLKLVSVVPGPRGRSLEEG